MYHRNTIKIILLLVVVFTGGCRRYYRYTQVHDPTLGRVAYLRTSRTVRRMSISAGGKWILVQLSPSGHEGNHFSYLIDSATMKRRWHRKDVIDSGFDPTGKRFFALSSDGRVMVYDLDSLSRLASYKVGTKFLRFAFLDSSRLVYSTLRELIVMDAIRGEMKATYRLPEQPEWVENINVSANGLWAVLSFSAKGNMDRKVALIELREGGKSCLLDHVSAPELSASGRFFAVQRKGGAVGTGETRSCRFNEKQPDMSYVSFLYNGEDLIISDRDNLYHYNLAASKPISTEPLPISATNMSVDNKSKTMVLLGQQSRPIGGLLQNSYWFGPGQVHVVWKHRWPRLGDGHGD